MCTQSRVAALHSRGGTSLAWYAVVDPKRRCLVRHSLIYSLIVLPGRAIGCPPSARSRTRLGSRCDGPLLADSRVSPWPPIATAERLGSCRERQLTGAAANSHYRPQPDVA